MLLKAKVVYVPAQPEIDADLSEYGHTGTKVRATYGEAACDAGDPDDDTIESHVIDALTNILHYAAREDVDIDKVLRVAHRHYIEEKDGE